MPQFTAQRQAEIIAALHIVPKYADGLLKSALILPV